MSAVSAIAGLLNGGVPYWVPAEDANAEQWDVASLGGTVLPGVAQVSAAFEHEYQVAKSQGQDGATVTDKGMKPKKFHMVLKMTTADQWSSFQDVVKQLNVDALGKSTQPYAFSHPYADLLGVQYVVVERISLPPPSSRSVYLAAFELVEWVQSTAVARPALPTFGQSGISYTNAAFPNTVP